MYIKNILRKTARIINTFRKTVGYKITIIKDSHFLTAITCPLNLNSHSKYMIRVRQRAVSGRGWLVLSTSHVEMKEIFLALMQEVLYLKGC